MKRITISITGHRVLSAAQQEHLRPVLSRAIENVIYTLSQEGEAQLVALSPLAEGADTLFAEAAMACGLPLRVILPFEREYYMRDFSGEDANAHFDNIYDHVPLAEDTVLGKYGGDQDDINQLYLNIGMKVVDECDYLVAIWNEKPGNGKGGTADVVAYAKEQKKNILLINPEDRHPFINHLHEDNYKGSRSVEAIDVSDTTHLARYLAIRQKEFDVDAVHYSRRYRRVWTAGFVAGLVEVFAFAIGLSFHMPVAAHFVLGTIEFFSLAFILLLLFFGRAKTLHSRYVHCRIISERLRIKKYFAELGFRIYKASVSPIYFSLNEKPEFRILDNTIRLINLSAYSYMPFEKKKKKLLDELIVIQCRYHEQKKLKFEQRNRLYKKVRTFLFLLFVAGVVTSYAHVVHEFFGLAEDEGGIYAQWSEFILFLSIFIPATIAACEALKYLYEWEKIITLSSAMANYFRGLKNTLSEVATDTQLEQFLNNINRDMLVENLDWEKYMHDKNEVPT
jgi:hypothetical protein